jgi:hypothetical protein
MLPTHDAHGHAPSAIERVRWQQQVEGHEHEVHLPAGTPFRIQFTSCIAVAALPRHNERMVYTLLALTRSLPL